jgi:hypothetical protein
MQPHLGCGRSLCVLSTNQWRRRARRNRRPCSRSSEEAVHLTGGLEQSPVAVAVPINHRTLTTAERLELERSKPKLDTSPKETLAQHLERVLLGWESRSEESIEVTFDLTDNSSVDEQHALSEALQAPMPDDPNVTSPATIERDRLIEAREQKYERLRGPIRDAIAKHAGRGRATRWLSNQLMVSLPRRRFERLPGCQASSLGQRTATAVSHLQLMTALI